MTHSRTGHLNNTTTPQTPSERTHLHAGASVVAEFVERPKVGRRLALLVGLEEEWVRGTLLEQLLVQLRRGSPLEACLQRSRCRSRQSLS